MNADNAAKLGTRVEPIGCGNRSAWTAEPSKRGLHFGIRYRSESRTAQLCCTRYLRRAFDEGIGALARYLRAVDMKLDFSSDGWFASESMFAMRGRLRS